MPQAMIHVDGRARSARSPAATWRGPARKIDGKTASRPGIWGNQKLLVEVGRGVSAS